MKNELHRDIFEARNKGDEQEVKIRQMWKDEVFVSVMVGGKMDHNWKIKGVFPAEDGEPLRVRIANPDVTTMIMVNADEFLKWQEGRLEK